ncbi:MAG TPA: sensor histidine kinase [Terriglobales bacterium]|nr:sensor histidine kinase [Terriglobales bacterium]
MSHTDTVRRSRSLKSTAARYGTAVLTSAVAILVAAFLRHFGSDSTVYIVLFPALVFSALYCGIGPAALATALSLVSIRYWLAASVGSLPPNRSAALANTLVFAIAAAMIVVMAEAHRRRSEALWNSHKELDQQVRERTIELDSVNGRLRHLTSRLLHLQDEERRRFARELHDSVGQTLAALGMNLSIVQKEIARLTKTAKTLADSEALVQDMSKEIRTISHLLHPPLLDEAGLVSALHWYAEGFAQRSNIKVELDIPEDFGRLAQELETAVFRIVQECLTNIHRHSGSPIARIRIARSNHEVLVEVSDSGKGIPKEKQEELANIGTPGVGIAGMRERLRQLSGSLEINSNANGTIVSVHLPIHTASVAAA